MHCYNMRREVVTRISDVLPWFNPNHTFTMCRDHSNSTHVFEDNWATPDFTADLFRTGQYINDTRIEDDLGCIQSESLDWAESAANSLTASVCPGYGTCANDNAGSECQGSYLFFGGDSWECYCFPWQLKFRANVRGSDVQVCQ